MSILFDEPSRLPLPSNADIEDHRAAIIKGALGAIPVLGGVLAEELGLVLAPPLTRRRHEWFEDLARRLHDLETRVEGFRFDDLNKNDQFVSATIQATQAVLRTHQKEKLEALRNAVLNVALKKEKNADRQAEFMAFVDRFQPLHLEILRFCRNPPIPGPVPLGRPVPDYEKPAVHKILFEHFKGSLEEISSQVAGRDAAPGQFLSHIVRDLVVTELLTRDLGGDKGIFGKAPQYAPWVTDLGLDFLDFITSPIEEEKL
jgi:hypothetical protein